MPHKTEFIVSIHHGNKLNNLWIFEEIWSTPFICAVPSDSSSLLFTVGWAVTNQAQSLLVARLQGGSRGQDLGGLLAKGEKGSLRSGSKTLHYTNPSFVCFTLYFPLEKVMLKKLFFG